MPGDTLHLNTQATQKNTFDAIVIGSGISGGWAAKELCEKGLKVLMLERGSKVEHPNYPTATKNPWDYQHRGKLTQEDKRIHYVQQRHYSFREDIVGGRSLLWARACYRWSDLDFEANAKDGIAIDWPIRYKDIEPWYDYVEKFAGVSGSVENLPELPDSHFLPAMEMNCVEKDLSARFKDHYKTSRKMIIGRCGHATVPMNGR